MKYIFITILHNLELDNIKNKGTKIFPGARISNGSQILSQIMKTSLMRDTLGLHSIDEFDNNVYFYIDGNFTNIQSKEQMDETGTENTFSFLRQAQIFCTKTMGDKG
ncbi:hypothetical protein [Pseudogracilibacillus sp. SO30301A]|uniref:hypothetical protein n=1 Tax=Pseudogracilibacillus sp. SO30301A TaxID=3098291 RepID=UPI00300E38C9